MSSRNKLCNNINGVFNIRLTQLYQRGLHRRPLLNSPRAQTEIFGLVIIVILLAIGLLFAIVILTRTPSTEVQRVKESVQAANFLNTIMSTTSTGCGKRSVRALVQDCALYGDYQNEEFVGATLCDDSQTNTCQMAHDMISQMLTNTLGKWGKNYAFFMNGTNSVEHLNVSTTACLGERQGSTRPEKITPTLDIQVTLHLCS